MKAILGFAMILIGLLGGYAMPARAESAPNLSYIQKISVCTSTPTSAGQGSCPSGTYDTHQFVLGPNGQDINRDGPSGTTDEHASVLPVDKNCTILFTCQYLFYVASGTAMQHDFGTVVLQGHVDLNGTWHLEYAPGYGQYLGGNGVVFRSPDKQDHCPLVTDNNPADQDPTFDLGYAASVSVVADPTSPPGNLLEVYEGVNGCFGTTGGFHYNNGGHPYITIGVATSADNGKRWPTYRGSTTFSFAILPFPNWQQGPNMPLGAFGAGVCVGNDCSTTPPDTYGRYAVLAPPASLADIMKMGVPLCNQIGDTVPSAFVDDMNPGMQPYLYVMHTYIPGDLAGCGVGGPPLPGGKRSAMAIARAPLNGGTARLAFEKWNGLSWAGPGVGGIEAGILDSYTSFGACGADRQSKYMGSINYFPDTGQYILFFACNSPGDPKKGQVTNTYGAAWMYSVTKNLSDPASWSEPKEVEGSWEKFETGGPIYKGWYPTFMSLGQQEDHLTNQGYAFYLYGDAGKATITRNYSSRRFTITVGTLSGQ